MQHQSCVNAANSLVNLHNGDTGELWFTHAASVASVCLFPQMNTAAFLWRLYGSVTGTLPTSQSTQNTPLCSHTHATNCRPFWISVCLTGGILCAALSDGLCLVCVSGSFHTIAVCLCKLAGFEQTYNCEEWLCAFSVWLKADRHKQPHRRLTMKSGASSAF